MELQSERMNALKSVIVMSLKNEEINSLEGMSSDVQFLLLDSLQLEKNERFGECVDTLQAVLDVTWEELNTGHWSQVPSYQRVIYAVASLLKVIALVQQALRSSDKEGSCFLEEAIKAADMGLLLGNSHRDQLTQAARLLSEVMVKFVPEDSKVSKPPCRKDIPELQVSAIAVPSLHSPSLQTFSAEYFSPRKPVKISGCMNHWPALRHWSDLDYLLTVAGSRTVPVELGSSYAHNDWSQRLMTLRDFVTQHIASPSCGDQSIGYLAQHQLFDQVPELRKDIIVPDYCCCSDGQEEEEEDVDINAWFGPAGTVSPLHYDPKHNLLCQVVGCKRVVLYSPTESDCLYPHEDRLLSNTAKVDPEALDYDSYPKYKDAQAYICLLCPGEMLYIPPTWWHHVRALELSFSVSFWWT